MRAHELISELFEPETAFPFEWEFFGTTIVAVAHDRQGRELNITFADWNNGMVDIDFDRGGSIGITGDGDAHRVMATVLSVILQYINMRSPDYAIFSSAEPSRTRMYASIVRRLSAKYGYQQITMDQLPPAISASEVHNSTSGSHKVFLLKRI